MYVQINKETRDSLQDNCIATLMMGSQAHGLSDSESDKDVLYIYYDQNYGKNIFSDTNGWQYKDIELDENYQEIRVFIRNLITAKMCGNLEALLDGWVSAIRLDDATRIYMSDLFKSLASFNSYAIIKSYIGYAKKDIKHATQILSQAGDKAFESRDFRKKLAHIIRGKNTIEFLLGKDEYAFKNESNHSARSFALEIRTAEMELDLDFCNSFLVTSGNKVKEYRDELNKLLDEQKINRRAGREELIDINSKVEYIITLLQNSFDASDILYDDNLRCDIIEKGENHQYF